MVPDVRIIKNSADITAHNAKVFAASPADQISPSLRESFSGFSADSRELRFFLTPSGKSPIHSGSFLTKIIKGSANNMEYIPSNL